MEPSALDGAAGDAGDDLVGQEDVQKEGGGEHDDHRGEHAAVVVGVLHALDHVVQAHGDGADCRLARKQHGHEELVPDGDEVEDGNGDDAGLCHQGEHDLPEGLDGAAAVDGGGLLKGEGEILEERKHKEDGERNVHRNVQEDDQAPGVGQFQAGDDREQRHDDHDDRDAQRGGEHVLQENVRPGTESGRAHRPPETPPR